MHSTARRPKIMVSADGAGIVSQAGGLLLTQVLRATGLDCGLAVALERWRAPRAVHGPGKMVADLAVVLALGGDCLADIALLRAQPELSGPVASDPVVSRLVARLAADAPRGAEGYPCRAGHRPAASGKIPARAWTPAYDAGGQVRPGAWVTEITGMFDLSAWPRGMRVIVRRERPHPGAQLRFTDIDGHRFTFFATDARRGQLADLELRHRRRARCESLLENSCGGRRAGEGRVMTMIL